jgi:hypothetical protein
MSIRALLTVPLAFLVSNTSSTSGPAHPASTLRIAPLSLSAITVRVTTSGLGGGTGKIESVDTLVAPPAVLPLADTIARIHVVVVSGSGAVRVIVTSNLTSSPHSLVSEGRDITLARVNGRFQRLWTAQQLVP